VNPVTNAIDPLGESYRQGLKNYHLLMARRVKDILLVAGLYDACIINAELRLEDRIGRIYAARRLSRPPRVTWVTSGTEALRQLETRDYDLVISTVAVPDMDAFELGRRIKSGWPMLPLLLLLHQAPCEGDPIARHMRHEVIDQVLTWSDDDEQLLAMIKSVEDLLNVRADTQHCGVGVILTLGGSPTRVSAQLPVIFNEILAQTETAMAAELEEDDRLLFRRARPKVLVADHPGRARALCEEFRPHLMGIICAESFNGAGEEGHRALRDFLLQLRAGDNPPPIFAAAESDARRAALSDFLAHQLGFGAFVFEDDQAAAVRRVATIAEMEQQLPEVPADVVARHARRRDFERWLAARGELVLAQYVRRLAEATPPPDGAAWREALLAGLRLRRECRTEEDTPEFDLQTATAFTGFAKIGPGSLGGKARGLAFLKRRLDPQGDFAARFPQFEIVVPATLVISTSLFERFVEDNDLAVSSRTQLSDEAIAARFLAAPLPEDLEIALAAFVRHADYPLAVRSSSLLEDSLARPYAGIYQTYMLPNDHPQDDVRLAELRAAVKLVYASTFFAEPRAFALRTHQKPDEEKMAVVIQNLVGRGYGDLFMPAFAGVAHAYNYYPVAPMRPEDGTVSIALGLGKTVVDGERALRFCPRYPQHLPQFSTVEDILENAQRSFYGLKRGVSPLTLGIQSQDTLDKREVADFEQPALLRHVVSTYLPEEHRLKDAFIPGGHPVVTFAPILKYDAMPLAEVLGALLAMGQQGLGGPVDVEFCVNLPEAKGARPQLAVLQIRPMAARDELDAVEIGSEEIRRSFCYSRNALGHGSIDTLSDILLVKPAEFDPAKTQDIAREIGRLNAGLAKEGRRYILIGPGRWGSQDPWLGIPVRWSDITAAAVIVETMHDALKADPSQGSHFFHNMTSLGMGYFNIVGREDFINFSWFASHPVQRVTRYLSHIRLERPVRVKLDGRNSQGIICDSA
jgi:CheY-like chemotaxis protein